MAGGRAGIHSVFCGWFYLFNITCDPVFVPVWSMAGEAPGIRSFTFSINLILTNIYRRLFDIYRLFGTELSILLNGILLSSSTYPE